jgi:nucleotide-binding universal stress UspA family protein
MAKTILVPLDTREESSWRRALPVALDLARHHGADLHLMTVIEPVEINLPGVPAPEEITRRRRDAAVAKLEQIAAAHLPPDFPHQRHARAGNIHREILSLAERIGADLIVMASHRPALSTYLLGTHAARVVRHATCSVYVVREGV